ncbi:hypothetical protein D9M69_360850 [compost metagenome]
MLRRMPSGHPRQRGFGVTPSLQNLLGLDHYPVSHGKTVVSGRAPFQALTFFHQDRGPLAP